MHYNYNKLTCTLEYGSGVNPSNSIGTYNPFRYRGYYYDSESGTYYCNSRYYDSQMGRWLNSDDISYLDPVTLNGLNLYAYCGNNPVNRYDTTGYSWESFWKGIGSALAIIGGIALCFVPGAQLIGAGLIIAGAGGLIGGAIGAATGYGFSAGWDVGTLIGGAIGLAVAAPQLWSLAANLTLPTLGWMSTGSSLIFGITGTVAVTVPVGAIAVGAGAMGLVMFAEHTSNKSPSKRNKHENGQAQRQREKFGGEKGDARRPYRKWKRNMPKILLPFIWFWDWLEDLFD